MAHQVSIYDSELPDVEDYISGDDRTLAFRVVDADGNAVDISNATVSWSLHSRAYQDSSDSTVLDGSDSGVELVTDTRVDTTNGEWEVRIDGEATEDGIYGDYYQRPKVEQQDETVASWRGKIIVEA